MEWSFDSFITMVDAPGRPNDPWSCCSGERFPNQRGRPIPNLQSYMRQCIFLAQSNTNMSAGASQMAWKCCQHGALA